MMHSTLTVSGRALLAEEPDCLNELAHAHAKTNQDVDEFDYHSQLQLLRNINGIAAPLRMSMERLAAKSIRHLPFIQSNNVMDDVLTGRYERISFSDCLINSQQDKPILSPHIVMEKALGLSI